MVLALVASVGGFALARSDDPQGLVLRIGCRITSRAQASADILNATVTGSSLEGAVTQLYRAYVVALQDRERECLRKLKRKPAPVASSRQAPRANLIPS